MRGQARKKTTRMSSVGEASNPRGKRGCVRDAAIVGSVILALVLVVGIAASFVFFMTNNTLKQEDMAGLSESKVYADLEALRIPAPDLSGYAYVSDEGLVGPHFEDIEIGSIRYGSAKDGRVTPSTRRVTAEAVWHSAALEVRRSLTADFEFVGGDESWRLVIHVLGELSATPLRPMNVYDLEGDIPALLRMYDPVLGEAYADAQIRLESDLGNDGGTVKATLTKALDAASEECVMNLTVSWSSTRGWIVEVASVTALSSGSVAMPSDQDAISPQPEEGDGAGQELYCHEGDLIVLTGALVQQDGVFVLQTSPTTVHMGGRTWNVERFVVTGSGSKLAENLGKDVTVRGYLTAAYVFEDAPLSIAMTSIS